MMLSMKKVLLASVATVLVAAIAGAIPQQADAGFGSSPGAPGARDDIAGYGFGRTASITDGTSNTIVTPANPLPARKAGGGQKDYY